MPAPLVLFSSNQGDFPVSATIATLLSAADQAGARAAIGAGNSSLVLGTTAGTAMAGNTPILSADAITAIAALNPASATAEQIVNALQAT